MSQHFVREYRFHAPLAEKLEEDLLYAIGKDWQDAEACKAELRNRGWTDAHIARYSAPWV